MNRPLKWLLGTIAALLLLILLAAVLVPLLFDAEDLKRTIETQGSKATGRELRIDGELTFSVFPWLAVEAGTISLANAPGFGAEPFARVAQARVGVGLMPLLRKELVADEIRLDGLQLDLQVNAQGVSNWGDLLQQDAAAAGGDDAAFANPSIAGLDLRDAVISYRDAAAGSHWVLSELALKTGALGGDDPVAVSLQTRLENRVAQQVVRLDLNTDLAMDLERQQFTFAELELEATQEEDGSTVHLSAPTASADLSAQSAVLNDLSLSAVLDAGATKAELRTPRLDADLEKLHFALEQPAVNASLDAGATQAEITASLMEGGLADQQLTAQTVRIAAKLDGGKSHGTIDASRLEADLERQRFGFTQPKAMLNLEGQAEAVPIEAARADLDLTAETLVLERFQARYAGADVSGSLEARDVLGEPRARGQLSIPSFIPRELLAALGLELPATADPQVLTRGSLQSDFEGGLRQMSLTGLQLGLDDSRISGALSLPDVEKGALRFDLDIDTIDLDRYLPPATEGSTDTTGTPSPLPRDELRGHDLQGTLRVGKLRLLGLDLEQAEMGVAAADNRVHLNPIKAGVFGGRYRGDIMLDASGEALEVRAQHNIESLGLQALGKAFAGLDSLTGTLVGQLVTNGRGTTTEQLLNSLSGSLDLQVLDGALEGVNLWHEVRKAYATYKGRPAPDPAPDRTEFSRLQLRGPIRDGVIETQELAGEVQVLSLSGKGAINLAQRQLDLGVTARVREVPEVAEDPLVQDLVGKRLPLRIRGPIADPGVGVDFAELLKSEAADALLRKLGGDQQRDPEEPVSEEDQLKDTARGLLRDLLRDKEEPPDEEDGDN